MSGNCPTCNEPSVMSCRCRAGDARCRNGHHWHSFDGEVHFGPWDHAKDASSAAAHASCVRAGAPMRSHTGAEVSMPESTPLTNALALLAVGAGSALATYLIMRRKHQRDLLKVYGAARARGFGEALVAAEDAGYYHVPTSRNSETWVDKIPDTPRVPSLEPDTVPDTNPSKRWSR